MDDNKKEKKRKRAQQGEEITDEKRKMETEKIVNYSDRKKVATGAC